MPNVRTLLRSFAGGEVSPDMYGRIDDDKYQTGAALMRNFIARAQGPAENRPGFSYVATVKYPLKKTRIIPFNFSSTDSCVIELGEGYFRFHKNGAPIMSGGVPYEVANTYTEAELFDIHYVQSNDVITLVHPNHAPATLSRTSLTPTWVLANISITPPINPPIDVQAIDNPPPTDPGPTKYTYSYVVTSIFTDGVSESAASTPVSVQSNLNETGRTVTIQWTAVSNASRYYVYKLQCGIYGYIGEIAQSSGTLSIKDENIAPDMSVTPPQYEDAFNLASTIATVTPSGGDSNYGTTRGKITTQIATVILKEQTSVGAAANPTTYSIVDTGGSGTGADINTIAPHVDVAASTVTGQRTYTITITFSAGGLSYIKPQIQLVWRGVTYTGVVNTANMQIPALSVNPMTVALSVVDTAGSGNGAILTPILSGGTSGSITGVTVTNPGQGYISPSVSVVNSLGGSGATFTVTLSTPTNGDYPGAVSYFEQRKCFAGTPKHPSQIWMTKSGTENNMSYSLPVQDDDRINFQVAAREANTIRHIVPLTQLLLLTNSAEWRVSSVNSDVLTPNTISVRPQSYIGASNVQPSVINNALVYCAARGGHVRECGYNWQAQGFITGDLSLRAAHLFDHLEIMDMCYSKAPQPLLWFVSSNGKLLGFTYIPEQSVGAWHQHDTDGSFESCTVVSEGSEDVLYVAVKRTVNGSTVRYVERMQTRNFTVLEEAFFVDSGKYVDSTYSTTATATFTRTNLRDAGTYLLSRGDQVSFTFSDGHSFVSGNVGSFVVVRDSSGNRYDIKITSVAGTTAYGTIQSEWPNALLVNPAATNPVTLPMTVAAICPNTVNLSWLIGKTVSMLGDGAVLPQQVVPASGIVTLGRGYIKLIAGLPYQSDLKTLPLALQVDAGYGQGRMKNVNKVWMRVNRSSGIFIGPDADNLTEAKQRTVEPYGSPPALKTEEVLVVITPTWADSGAVYVRQEDPLPLTIVNMTMEVALGA